jgi:hypothetical protein
VVFWSPANLIQFPGAKDVFFALPVFLLLSLVVILHRAQIPHDPAPDLRFPAADRAGEMLARDIAVVVADGKSGSQGKVRKLIGGKRILQKALRRARFLDLFPQIKVQDRSAGL